MLMSKHLHKIARWASVFLTLLITWFGGMGSALTPDGLALMEFRNALTTISPVLESWNASDPSPCSWGGIACTGNGRVQDIILPEQVPKLEGHISASLGKLKLLEMLWLDSNLLSGSIPPEIGNLSNLRMLSLSFQNFSGDIPPELGNCTSLVKLWLNSNNFTGDITTVMGSLNKLANLTVLDVSDNKFSGNIPRELGNLTSLEWFGLGNNQLVGTIPTSLGHLVNQNMSRLIFTNLVFGIDGGSGNSGVGGYPTKP